MKEYKKPIIDIAIFDSSEKILTQSAGIEASDSSDAIQRAVGINTADNVDFKEVFAFKF